MTFKKFHIFSNTTYHGAKVVISKFQMYILFSQINDENLILLKCGYYYTVVISALFAIPAPKSHEIVHRPEFRASMSTIKKKELQISEVVSQ